MPVYNAEKYLGESIESILNQSFKDFEFLIMDDGSTDKSAAILDSYARKDARLKIFHQKNKGIVESLNTLAKLAQAELLARMDSDDIAMPERFYLQYDYLKKHPETVLIAGRSVTFLEKKNKNFESHSFSEDVFNRWFLTINPPFRHPEVIFRKKAFFEAGGYRKDFYPAEDYDLWIRLKRSGKIDGLSQNLMRIRLTSTGISGKNFRRQIQARDQLQRINFEDILKHHEIPSIETIKNLLQKYRIDDNLRRVLGKLACLTGCFLVEKKDLKRATDFFRLAITLDKRRIDAMINLHLQNYGKALLFSFDVNVPAKTFSTKIHRF